MSAQQVGVVVALIALGPASINTQQSMEPDHTPAGLSQTWDQLLHLCTGVDASVGKTARSLSLRSEKVFRSSRWSRWTQIEELLVMPLKDYIAMIPPELIEENGAAFISGAASFGRQHPLMIVSANPGGDIESHAGWSIRYDCETVRDFWPEDCHGYIDGYRWPDSQIRHWTGGARVAHLVANIGYNLREVPTQHLVFLRSSRLSALHANYEDAVSLCWPVMAVRIEEWRPRVIIALGGKAGDSVLARLGGGELTHEFTEDNARHWKSRLCRSSAGPRLAVLTHPGIADWTAPSTDPSDLIRMALEDRP